MPIIPGPPPSLNRRLLLGIAEHHGLELWLDGGRLMARWTALGPMHPGADGFLRRFRDELVQALRERDGAGTPAQETPHHER